MLQDFISNFFVSCGIFIIDKFIDEYFFFNTNSFLIIYFFLNWFEKSSSKKKSSSRRSDDDDSDDDGYERGDRVEAKVSGWTKYYGGEITRKNRDGTYDIKFGDAQISEKHTNFFINKNNATFSQMNSLINFVKKNF